MITTASLPHSYNYVCACMLRTFEIYSLSISQIYSTVLVTVHHAVPHILRAYSSYN